MVLRPILRPIQRKISRPIFAQPIPFTQMDLISNLIFQRGIGPAIFTRSTIGTEIDRLTLLVTTFAIDAARFGINGVLIEGESTNEALHNRDFTDVAHVKTNITALKDAVGADGVINAASTLTATAANGTVFQTVTKASAENTYSIDIRRKTGTGTIEISDDGGVGFTDITSSINSSTYTRFQITSTQANPEFGVRIVTSSDEIEVDYEGLEELPFASSRIETTTTSVTRASDNLSIDAANIPVPTADYSVGAEVDIFGNADVDFGQIFWQTTGETTRRCHAALASTGLPRYQHTNTVTGLLLTPNNLAKIVNVNNSINIELFQGTVSQGTAATGAVTGTKSSISIGSASGQQYLFGHLKNFKIFDIALTADEVANL